MPRWMSVLRTPLGLAATVLTVGVLVLAVLAPILWTDDANAVDTSNILAGPSADHWAGTDNLGRDIFFRTLVATRLSVELALLATSSPSLSGCCWARRRTSSVVGRAGWCRGRSTPRWPSRGCCWRSSSPSSSGWAPRERCSPSGSPALPCSPGSPRRWWPASPPVTTCQPPGSRGWAGCASCSATSFPTSPSRSSSTPPSAPAARCCPSPGSRSSASACSSPDYDWGRLLFDGSARSTSTRPRRSRPAPPCCSRAWP